MHPRFEYGETVRVVRTLRDDGTFPGKSAGDILVRAGAVGHVRNVGTYLQEQIIYAVHFFELDRIVGCREEELIPADETWIPTRYIFGDKVVANIPLSVRGATAVPAGSHGEVIKVLRHAIGGPAYEVYFNGRTFLVPETALDAEEVAADAAVADA